MAALMRLGIDTPRGRALRSVLCDGVSVASAARAEAKRVMGLASLLAAFARSAPVACAPLLSTRGEKKAVLLTEGGRPWVGNSLASYPRVRPKGGRHPSPGRPPGRLQQRPPLDQVNLAEGTPGIEGASRALCSPPASGYRAHFVPDWRVCRACACASFDFFFKPPDDALQLLHASSQGRVLAF